jgi:phage repressor protein C with HTH and peptisase S24 domain
VNGIDMAVHIYGESMYPDIPNGSVVYVKKISGRIIDFGKPYILDTVDGPLLKYVAPGHDDGFVKCISANHDPMYAPFEVSKTDIIGMYRVVMCMSMK